MEVFHILFEKQGGGVAYWGDEGPGGYTFRALRVDARRFRSQESAEAVAFSLTMKYHDLIGVLSVGCWQWTQNGWQRR